MSMPCPNQMFSDAFERQMDEDDAYQAKRETAESALYDAYTIDHMMYVEALGEADEDDQRAIFTAFKQNDNAELGSILKRLAHDYFEECAAVHARAD